MGACVAVPARWEIESEIHSHKKTERDLISESFLAQDDNRGSTYSIMIIYSSKITHYHHTHPHHITIATPIHAYTSPPLCTSPTALPPLTHHRHPSPNLHITTTPAPLYTSLLLPSPKRTLYPLPPPLPPLYPPAGGPCAWVAVAVVGVVAGAVVVAEGYCTVSTREANRLVCGVLRKRRA